MTEPLPELDRTLQQVGADWDEARTERSLQGAHAKRAARSRRARIATGAALLCVPLGVMAAGAWLTGWYPSLSGSEQVAAERVIAFADGSRAELLNASAQVVVADVSPTAIDVELNAGSARFDVAPRPERRFRVHSGDVTVQVLGTAFDLTRSGARTHVEVLRGRVAVRWTGGATELVAGEAGWYPRDDETEPAAGTQVEASDAEPRAERSTAVPARKTQSWRQHAEQGDFNRAYALLESERAKVADDVEELLLAADAARLSGHPTQALPFLHKVVDLHARDPRAPLAAFTLGGVLMNQLGRPREAGAAYARALELSPPSSLAQDTLARQVEAAHRAGDPDDARGLALEYLERYPHGRRVKAVRRFGGLP